MEREYYPDDFQIFAVTEVSEAMLQVICGSPVAAPGDARRAGPSLNEGKEQV